MNPKHDPFEEELKSFRPMSVSPELERRIAARLAQVRPDRLFRQTIFWLGGIVVVLGIAGALLNLRREPAPLANRKIPVKTSNGALAVNNSDHLPTLLSYRRAFNESPEALDEALARDASDWAMANSASTPTQAFIRSNDQFLD